MASQSSGLQNGILNANIQSVGCHRLGMKLAAGVFSVCGANGSDLSNLNLGYVSIPSSTTPGVINTYAINANQSFSDSSSSGSTIIGNTFGTATGDIWSVDVPFYLYVCIDNANSTPIFGISRIPNMTQAPIAANIGTPASATADVSYGMFLFSSVTIGNYDLNPVVCLGAFRMQKVVADDWTVQSLSNSDGIGRFLEDKFFTYPTGVNGNAAGKYFANNGGTAPIFNDNGVNYKIQKNGMLFVTLYCANLAAPSSAGLGAVAVTFFNPLTIDAGTYGTILTSGYGGFQNTAGNPFFSMAPVIQPSSIQFRKNDGTVDFLENVDFDGTAGYSIQFCTNNPLRVA